MSSSSQLYIPQPEADSPRTLFTPETKRRLQRQNDSLGPCIFLREQKRQIIAGWESHFLIVFKLPIYTGPGISEVHFTGDLFSCLGCGRLSQMPQLSSVGGMCVPTASSHTSHTG